uniref:NADH-ubiquinone oxidoreductase chain 2 n=1 Tax=Leptocerus tineiformis TaxID=1271726 RepID=A0A7D6WF22_9NEOP|nr:NADH dehydrogenase subunit 2 [Leptocerus tineiformis]
MLLYFFIQSISSMNFFFFIIFFFLFKNKFLLNFNYENMVINLILFMKMGAAPVHFWFPKIMKNLNWIPMFMLMTWQKIIPMIFLSYCLMTKFLLFFITLNVMIGSIMGMNQTNLKLILSFSSINHMGWLITCLTLNINFWLIYFFNYTLLNYIIIKMFKLMNLKFLSNLYTLNYTSLTKIILSMNFLSLSGLPPFFGFFPKWLVLMELMLTSKYFIFTLLIFTTLINLFFYLRIMISNFLMSNFNILWMTKNFFKNFFINKIMAMTFFSMFMLMLFLILTLLT